MNKGIVKEQINRKKNFQEIDMKQNNKIKYHPDTKDLLINSTHIYLSINNMT